MSLFILILIIAAGFIATLTAGDSREDFFTSEYDKYRDLDYRVLTESEIDDLLGHG